MWNQLPSDVRDRSDLSPDQCVVNDEFFFVKGVIDIAVHGGAEGFSWCVWVSLSEKNFLRAGEVWEDPQRTNEPPYFGWLCNSIPGYPETLHLKTMVHTRKVGLRPLIELEATNHPLSLEQRNGITAARVREIAETMYHHNLRLNDGERFPQMDIG
jgi:hypothetical protein